MARYRGPKTKIARRFGDPIFGPDSAFDNRNYPPGQHGLARKRGKKSEYAVQLAEKQKAKYTYGILERQFRNLFEKASRQKGITGENLLQLCEARLDNVVYRMGIAPTRRAARQLVSHRHIMVNGKQVNIPSYHVLAGGNISVRERSRSLSASPHRWKEITVSTNGSNGIRPHSRAATSRTHCAIRSLKISRNN